MFYEFERILPLLLDPDSEQLLKDEVENNQILQVNNRKARERFVVEFKRRFNSVPFHFWQTWQGWSETGKRAGLFYAILKTYKLVFDFHFNVAIRHWNSINHQLGKSDIMMEFNEIAAHDDFVDSWSDSTKGKCASAFLTILRLSALIPGSVVSPSTPQFQLRLSSAPSVLFQLFSSLCFVLYVYIS